MNAVPSIVPPSIPRVYTATHPECNHLEDALVYRTALCGSVADFLARPVECDGWRQQWSWSWDHPQRIGWALNLDADDTLVVVCPCYIRHT